MAIQLSPADGLRNVAAYPTNPTTEAAAREQIQSVIDQVVTQSNSELAEMLKKTDFTQSIQTAGYQKLPSGLILQWGSAAINFTAGQSRGNVSGNFPIEFPGFMAAISCGIFSSGAASAYSSNILANNKSSYTTGVWRNLDTSSAETIYINWMAIGY